MITRPRAPHIPHQLILRLSSRSIIRAGAVALACVASTRARAQAPTSLQTDATVLPRGAISLTAASNWTRFDALLGVPGAPSNLGVRFSADSLGVAQVPSFAASESAIRAATGNSAFSLNAGQLTTVANSRVVTAPIIAQYGLTSRLTLGVVVPLVETRTTVTARMNPKLDTTRLGLGRFANVGPNQTGNFAVVTGIAADFAAAKASLNALYTQCQATPTASNCAAVIAQAPALMSASTQFANALAALYGTDAAHPGQQLIPLANSPAQNAIMQQFESFRTSYQSLLDSDAIQERPLAGAGGPIAFAQLDTLLARAGYDTLGLADHTSIGDITIGATYQLANSFGDSVAAAAGATLYRLAVSAAGRIGTGQPANRNQVFDNATGYGQPGAIIGAAADLLFRRRYTLTGLASYTANFGSVDVARIPNFQDNFLPLTGPVAGTYSAGNVLMLSLIPRMEFARYFSLNGEYQLVHVAGDTFTPSAAGSTDLTVAGFSTPPGLAAATAQQIGFGFAYSTVSSSDRGPGRIPFEVSFRHLETIAGSGGPVPKTFQDQLTVRVFFPRG